MSKIQEAIQHTEAYLKLSQDPAMVAVLAQLKQALDGKPQPLCSIGRIVTSNYVPAPVAELEDWVDLVLEAWKEIKARK
jgi:hypothetical protein